MYVNRIPSALPRAHSPLDTMRPIVLFVSPQNYGQYFELCMYVNGIFGVQPSTAVSC